MSQDARYLLLVGLTLGSCLLFAASVNAIIDPYGFFRWITIDGFNAIKPRAEQQVARNKAYGIVFRKPESLILGNSRAEIGIDPESPFLGVARSNYNAAIPGSGPTATVEYLQHAMAQGQLRRVVIGLEFLDFLADQADIITAPAQSNRSTAMDTQAKLRDAMSALFSLDAVGDSLSTLLNQRNPFAATIDPAGFNPMRDYEGIATIEGYGALFMQKNRENARNFLKQQKYLENNGVSPGASWTALRRLRDLCNEKTVKCYFLIYPYHADILEMFDATGLWQAFEQWKREVVLTLAPSQAGGATTSVLWDFSGYNEYTTERVPSRADRKSVMRWYWEAGHFKSALGEKMLQRMLNRSGEPFGTQLTAINLEEHLSRLREERDHYRVASPIEAARIRRVILDANRQ